VLCQYSFPCERTALEHAYGRGVGRMAKGIKSRDRHSLGDIYHSPKSLRCITESPGISSEYVTGRSSSRRLKSQSGRT
jgi:hypothetical protein